MEKINVAQLLKDCPQGMELDCTIWDNEVKVFLKEVLDEGDDFAYPIIVTVKYNNIEYTKSFTKYGAFNDLPYCNCVIFPKGKTTWEGFVPPCKFKDGDIVYVQTCSRYGSGYEYICIYKENSVDNDNLHKYVAICGNDFLYNTNALCLKSVITNIRLATEEEKEILFKAIKDNGYKWNAETKTLEKLPKFKIGDRITNGIVTGKIRSRDVDSYQLDNGVFVFFNALEEWKLYTSKFNINTLVPFESKVLVRDKESHKWKPAIWGFYDKDSLDYQIRVVGGYIYRYCIPYDGNEHLLATNNDCDDYYKTWEK